MGNSQPRNGNDNVEINSSGSRGANIITNHDFSHGLDNWHANCCKGFIVPMPTGNCAVVTNRTEAWQGLQQNITTKVSSNSTYAVSALVSVSGPIRKPLNVQATLRLEFDRSTDYLRIGRSTVSEGQWQKVEGAFTLSEMPRRAVFYLEGPPPGVNILVDSVEIVDDSEILRNAEELPMAAPETKLSLKLKLLVDTKGDRVVCAEAGKDFVDFLFNLLSLPVGTVTRILSSLSMVGGSLGNIFDSVENFDDEYKEASFDALLKPDTSVAVPDGGYVKGRMTYVITEGLEVRPMSTITSISILNKYNIKDIGVLEERVVYVGMDEGVEMLKASFHSKSVLTDVFLGKKASVVSVCDVD